MVTKAQFYHTIGDGRDSYIYFNSGGLYPPKQPVPEYPVSSFRGRRRAGSIAPQSPDRTMRYHSNGTGRDNYIVSTSGGFESRTRNFGPNATFYASLRESDGLMRRTLGAEDYMEVQRTWLPVAQRRILFRRSQAQRALTSRLYKTPTNGSS